ncbi:MAG TPA: cell division protein FtsA [Clostridia bacterium]|nr:cell division protein FtsA [Clostridia bacterium]
MRLAGLDIGSTKVAVVVGDMDGFGNVDFIGAGTSACNGVRKGAVVNIEETVRAVTAAVTAAGRMAGSEIGSVFLSLGSSNISVIPSGGVVSVSREDREISPEDVARVLEAAKAVGVESDREVIHILPKSFGVDGCDGIKDPVGMVGLRLEVQAQVITAPASVLENLERCVLRAGLEIEGTVLSPIASSLAVLGSAEMDLGAAVVNIGGGTTQVAVYSNGVLQHTAILPLGSTHITQDIAVGLRVPIPEAEKLKIKYGIARSSSAGDDVIEFAPVPTSKSRVIPRRAIADIIEPRVEEILSLVGQELALPGRSRIIPGGVVLTGGGSSLQGLAEFAQDLLEMPVRIGVPAGKWGIGDILQDPGLSTAVGTVLFARDVLMRSATHGTRARKSYVGGLIAGLVDRVSSLFAV